MIITQILEEKEKELSKSKESRSQDELTAKAKDALNRRRSFKHALTSHKDDVHLIAEIKKASPSRGIIREDFNPAEIAKIYQINGACAISVLTEEKFFQGSLEYIKKIKAVCSLPVLRKDFIIDEYQIYESAAYEADAILLIADILTADEIQKFKQLAADFKMDSLVEAHSEEDLEKARKAEADIIGINNRDLHTFKLNLSVTQNLINLIPKGKIIISESGIKSRQDALYLKSLGVNAVLIGEAFMESQDIGVKVREVLGK